MPSVNTLHPTLSPQQLTSEEIAELRHKLRDGEAIVDALTQHSATFASKTEFAQAKYKKKKAKKYVVRAIARRAPAAAIAQAYYLRQPARIGHLRLDTLSLLLSLANVGAGARVLAVDACGGLVLGAAAERLGGHGAVQGAYFGTRAPSREALSQFDCPRVAEVVREHAVEDVLAAARRGPAAESADAGVCSTEPEAASKPVAQQSPDEPTEDLAPGALSSAADALEDDKAEEGAARGDTHAQRPQSAPAPPLSGFSCCIVAAPSLDPSSVLTTILPLLRPSAAFAVYSPWQQPLAEAMHELRTAHRAVNLSLQESWWRAAQVLPGRTHPTMQMNHGGGYVFSGVTVAPP